MQNYEMYYSRSTGRKLIHEQHIYGRLRLGYHRPSPHRCHVNNFLLLISFSLPSNKTTSTLQTGTSWSGTRLFLPAGLRELSKNLNQTVQTRHFCPLFLFVAQMGLVFFQCEKASVTKEAHLYTNWMSERSATEEAPRSNNSGDASCFWETRGEDGVSKWATIQELGRGDWLNVEARNHKRWFIAFSSVDRIC